MCGEVAFRDVVDDPPDLLRAPRELVDHPVERFHAAEPLPAQLAHGSLLADAALATDESRDAVDLAQHEVAALDEPVEGPVHLPDHVVARLHGHADAEVAVARGLQSVEEEREVVLEVERVVVGVGGRSAAEVGRGPRAARTVRCAFVFPPFGATTVPFVFGVRLVASHRSRRASGAGRLRRHRVSVAVLRRSDVGHACLRTRCSRRPCAAADLRAGGSYSFARFVINAGWKPFFASRVAKDAADPRKDCNAFEDGSRDPTSVIGARWTIRLHADAERLLVHELLRTWRELNRTHFENTLRPPVLTMVDTRGRRSAAGCPTDASSRSRGRSCSSTRGGRSSRC